jgi:hypothetical protein
MYVISIPCSDEPGETKEIGFPDTENLYNFLDYLQDEFDISGIVLPKEALT